jgi:hypothetical protein
LWINDQFNDLSWEKQMVAFCVDTIKQGYRGLVNPHVKVFFDEEIKPACVNLDPSFGDDPYFHPAFKLTALSL